MDIFARGINWLFSGGIEQDETFDIQSEDQLIVCVCGGGNGAHVVAGLAASRPGIEARVLTLYDNEAEEWTQAMAGGTFKVFVKEGGIWGEDVEINVDPFVVSKRPRDVIQGAHIIVFAVPAYCHEMYFDAIEPFVGNTTTIIGLPGVNGFEFQLRGILQESSDQCTIMNFETLPWISRIKEYGRSVDLLATRETIDGAIHLPRKPSAFHHNHLASFQYILGDKPVIDIKGHLLAITLMTPNTLAHPTIMYGQWKGWDGEPLEERPLFFHGVSQATVDLLSRVSQEAVEISRQIMKRSPEVDLSNVQHIYDWYLMAFENDISDKSDLMSALKTNKAYARFKHPCTRTENGKYVPNFQHRYLTEDVTFGLVVVKGIAEIVEVATPSMDKIINWAQGVLGKQYLIGGKLRGRDLKATRAPQRYGLNTLSDILKENVLSA